MSAFPESGRSDTAQTAEMKVRYRPGAAILIGRYLIVGTVFGVDIVIDFLHDLWEWLAAT